MPYAINQGVHIHFQVVGEGTPIILLQGRRLQGPDDSRLRLLVTFAFGMLTTGIRTKQKGSEPCREILLLSLAEITRIGDANQRRGSDNMG